MNDVVIFYKTPSCLLLQLFVLYLGIIVRKNSRSHYQCERNALFEIHGCIQVDAIADQERLIATQERNEKEKLAAYLRSLGINPDEIP